VEDNYVNVAANLRSPKSLSELCIETICRSIPNMNGELPSGLPQDVVDDIVASLIHHSALTATTLRVLKNCELNSLSLAGCRGVTDAWLESLTTNDSSSSSCPSCSNTSSPVNSPISITDAIDDMDPMDLERTILSHSMSDINHQNSIEPPSDVFYGSFSNHIDRSTNQWDTTRDDNDDNDEHLSCCSTTSFVSAKEHHYPNSGHHRINSKRQVNDNILDTEMKHQDDEDVELQPTYMTSSVTMNMTLLDIRGSYSLSDRGLMQLMNLQRLDVAKLDNCHSITGRGLLAFCHSHQLHTLSLSNCRRLTDEALINISHLISLQALSLGGCRCITDRSLAAIADLYKLQRLDLSQCDLITDRGLQQLEHLTLIEELSLGWCRQVTDIGIDMLTQHHGRDENLHVLRLARCPITDVGVDHLSRLVALEELDLNGCANITSSAVGAALEKMKRLSILDVSYCPSIMYVLFVYLQ
jgi:hypothetical protein